jgi:hypothetical protein
MGASGWIVALTAALAAGAAPAPHAPGAGAKPATLSDARDAFDQGQYPRALQLVTRVLAAKGEAAKGLDRYELLVLKGESHLRLKNSPAAAEAFDEAAKFAADEKTAALARAMGELVRRSKGSLYTPPAEKGAPPPRPIDITDRSQRVAAFAAMFRESEPKVSAAAEAARRGVELPKMLEALRMLWDLRTLEVAATDGDAESKKLGAELAEKARYVMARAVAQMGDTVSQIESSASQVYEDVRPAGGAAYANSNVVGLGKDDIHTLRQIAADCDRIAGVAADLKSIAPSDQGDALRALRDDAAAVASNAREVEKAYGRFRQATPYGDPGGYGGGYGPDGQAQPGARRGGTTAVHRPVRDNPSAGPRGVDTSGRNRVR